MRWYFCAAVTVIVLAVTDAGAGVGVGVVPGSEEPQPVRARDAGRRQNAPTAGHERIVLRNALRESCMVMSPFV
jgi:hypothetical protein